MTTGAVNTVFPWRAIASVVAALNSGCVQFSALEADYGQSVRQMQYAQTWNKAAILDPQLAPVTGIDGLAAANALKDYRGAFAKPTKDPTKEALIINFTGLGGGSQ